MAYCTTDDVLRFVGRLGKSLSADSTPSTGDISGFIDGAAARIDGVLLSRGLTTPVKTPTTFVSALKELNAIGAAAATHMAAYITNDTNDRGAGGALSKIFESQLAAYVRGEGIPVGASVAEQDLAPRSDATDNVVVAAPVGALAADYWARFGGQSSTGPWFTRAGRR